MRCSILVYLELGGDVCLFVWLVGSLEWEWNGMLMEVESSAGKLSLVDRRDDDH